MTLALIGSPRMAAQPPALFDQNRRSKHRDLFMDLVSGRGFVEMASHLGQLRCPSVLLKFLYCLAFYNRYP